MTESNPRILQSTPVRAGPPDVSPQKPPALLVFLENVGHIAGMALPQWTMDLIDWGTEEYAKVLLRLYGVYRRYDRVVILEDEEANGPALAHALLSLSKTHRIDLLLLVHGHVGCLVGHRGEKLVGPETFGRLRRIYAQDETALDLRMVYGLNCHGATLATTWLDLGAHVANGAIGVNWFPEPSLSVFLRRWLRGDPYSTAVLAANRRANQVWRRLLRSRPDKPHPWIISSRQTVYGRADLTIRDG